ncbi:MAG: hypothetical protein KGI02_07500 [Thaumarchaeota archaeon]|nr:hypothetical protein [Nitrososphaerota archaeon]
MIKPISALYGWLNKDVAVICKDGTSCTGRIAEVDEYMNIVLQDYSLDKNGNSDEGNFLIIRGVYIAIVRLDLDKKDRA